MEYLGRMILLVYLMISVVTPLSTVHVEDQTSSLCWSAGHQGRDAGTVLVRLHEMLFRHFSDRVDHVAFSRGPGLQQQAGANVPIRTAPGDTALLCRPGDTVLPNVLAAYSRLQEGTTPPADGFRLFLSSLSPPAA